MCGLKAAQMHEWPFRAAKELQQPLAAQDSFFALGKRYSDIPPFIIHALDGYFVSIFHGFCALMTLGHSATSS